MKIKLLSLLVSAALAGLSAQAAVTDKMIDDDARTTGDVLSWGLGTQGQRYSPLKGVNTANVGKLVIEQMKLTEPRQWTGGRLYNPEDGRDYKGSLQLRSDSTLVVSGCVLFVCQTQVWRRADTARCPPISPP